MTRHKARARGQVARIATLFCDDTILRALGRMQRLGLSAMRVIEPKRGVELGEVTQEELYRGWARGPLATLKELFKARDTSGLLPRRVPA
jgi:hypothetical protein